MQKQKMLHYGENNLTPKQQDDIMSVGPVPADTSETNNSQKTYFVSYNNCTFA